MMMTLAIACSGGGNWCIAQLGFIHALHERGYQTHAASGVSFGAWSAWSAVTGDVYAVFVRLKRFYEHLDLDLLKPWRHGMFSPRQVMRRMEEAFELVLPTKVEVEGDYFVMVLTMPHFRAMALDKGHSLPDMLRAAIAMPPLPAARYGRHILRDAGLRMKYGIRPLVASGYRNILCLGTYSDRFDVRWKGMQSFSRAYHEVQVYEHVMPMARRIGAANFSRSGFAAMDSVFEMGYRQGLKFSSEQLDELLNPWEACGRKREDFRLSA